MLSNNSENTALLYTFINLKRGPALLIIMDTNVWGIHILEKKW